MNPSLSRDLEAQKLFKRQPRRMPLLPSFSGTHTRGLATSCQMLLRLPFDELSRWARRENHALSTSSAVSRWTGTWGVLCRRSRQGLRQLTPMGCLIPFFGGVSDGDDPRVRQSFIRRSASRRPVGMPRLCSEVRQPYKEPLFSEGKGSPSLLPVLRVKSVLGRRNAGREMRQAGRHGR